jgi:hypothetical protein
MQLYLYFVSQFSEFCSHNRLCFLWKSVYFVIYSVRRLLDTPSYSSCFYLYDDFSSTIYERVDENYERRCPDIVISFQAEL